MKTVTSTYPERELIYRQKPLTIWLTGLSGAGKSTISHSLEKYLLNRNYKIVFLDGDDIRKGLCSDLGFSQEHRKENLRRAAHAARLINDSGLMVVASFISPLISDRRLIKEIVGENNFLEIFVKTSLQTCEKRDVKGLYKKARAGEIIDFTGISSPYEPPSSPNMVLDTELLSIEECTKKLSELIVLENKSYWPI